MRSHVPAILPSRAGSRAGLSWGDLVAFAEACLARRGQRLQLRELTDDQLKDVGLSRADVERELRRWSWDGPKQGG
jgi:uncharacterized protein YjiS (DUF1127 family)